MKKTFFVAGYLLLVTSAMAQTVSQKLEKAFQQFENDSQLKHAISSLYVIDARTGKLVFDKNSQVGLAPASTQKIITSVTAFELLGKEYRYKTELGYDGKIDNGILKGNLYIIGSGDPTLGSVRWNGTKEGSIMKKIISSVQKEGINKIAGNVYFDESKFSIQPVPEGWIWQDIGNYYGAGAWCLNWRENQYDLYLKSGSKVGDETQVTKSDPELQLSSLVNTVKTAAKGTGDNAFIYSSPYSASVFATGTIPANESAFKISGAIPYPSLHLIKDVENYFNREGINVDGAFKLYIEKIANNRTWPVPGKRIDGITSPSLDSIIYWLNKKSINLYAEALIKTFSYEKQGFGSTDSGVAIVKEFWKQKGLDENELNISDGSGLSPQNRVTTHAQVEILKYAKNKSWFPYFFQSLPEYNGMIMKSGTIKDVKGFCGYHKAKDGKEYIFSFLVNNYNGPTSGLVNKMYKVLDVLK